MTIGGNPDTRKPFCRKAVKRIFHRKMCCKVITVKDFAAKYKVSLQGVYEKIRKSGAALEGHVFKSGGRYVLDETAEERLKPRPADHVFRDKIAMLQSEAAKNISDLHTLSLERDNLMQRCDNQQAQLDEYRKRIAELEGELSECKVRAADDEKRISELSEKNQKLSAQLCTLSDEILERDRRIEILETSVADTPKRKKLWG